MAPTLVNYVNLGVFVLNIIFTFVSNTGIFGGNTNASVSDKYLTIVTPAGYTFSIWGLIFTAQGLFSVVQFLPHYSASPLVTGKSGFAYFWAAACIFQSAWSIAFVNLQIVLSSVLIILIALSLLGVVYAQARVVELNIPAQPVQSWLNNSWVEYFLLVFPFRIHLAWVTAASAVAVNIDFVDLHRGDVSVLLAVAIVSVAVLVFFATTVRYTTSEVFGVFAWAFGGIASNLASPPQDLLNTFGPEVLQAYRNAAVTVAIAFGVLVIPSFFFKKQKDNSFDYKKAPNSNVAPGGGLTHL
eukprot:c12748_g1_i1.p1 GENE.c12748_g1_i1~~c12748_g1_i1.p1  ORF type:complete len:299 (+),score=103.79 c12748_g1_i1:59-955(+)